MVAEPETAARARDRAGERVPIPPIEHCSLLRWAATTVAARHVVEVGAAAGVTAIWTLLGCEDRALLTSIEPEAVSHGLATAAYAEAGVEAQVRPITGDPKPLLDRLSESSYELCVLQSRPREHTDYLPSILQILRPGGLLVAFGADGEFLQALDERYEMAAATIPGDPAVTLATKR